MNGEPRAPCFNGDTDTSPASESSVSSTSTLSTIESCLAKKKEYDFNHPRALEIIKCLMEMIAVDLQPFSMVTNKGFRKLIKLLEPTYVIPSDKYFRETALPHLYVNARAKVSLPCRICYTIFFFMR